MILTLLFFLFCPIFLVFYPVVFFGLTVGGWPFHSLGSQNRSSGGFLGEDYYLGLIIGKTPNFHMLRLVFQRPDWWSNKSAEPPASSGEIWFCNFNTANGDTQPWFARFSSSCACLSGSSRRPGPATPDGGHNGSKKGGQVVSASLPYRHRGERRAASRGSGGHASKGTAEGGAGGGGAEGGGRRREVRRGRGRRGGGGGVGAWPGPGGAPRTPRRQPAATATISHLTGGPTPAR